ncbi:hypothetical protein [Dyella sp. GSA-30]|uniref:hypothetical protein n=1 Tax=Dyella sp. GSA-30 TaxID=2994496 RepID=UPI0024914F87|nr:hypothetical protein [Dyella sp. GSA-30]BDU21321.1 hypothetical protein DYGSA30_27780 [Dyella sp. GSA-30]
MTKRFRIALFSLVLLALAGALAGCHRTPDEERIRQAIAAAGKAAEQADASALADVLSDDFDGNGGQTDKRELSGLLRAAKFRGETIHALIGPIDVEQRGERYVAKFSVTLTSGGKLLPAQMGVYQVESGWRREGKMWACFTATWSQ